MPLRPAIFSSPLPAWQGPCRHLVTRGRYRPFHSTPSLRDEAIDRATTHYEALKVDPGATPAEIKKSFYSLSKSHHPDHNQDDPRAAQRFMRISEAYSVLSIPAKRSAYDRDVLRLHASDHQHQQPRGSYSSTGPAGGRPATGLSKRRGTFKGPPPSFYRNGGWGGQETKRRAAHEESTGGGGGSSAHDTSGGGWSSPMGGMGPGQDPFGHHDEVPHFDKEGHERTGRHVDERRAARQRQAESSAGSHVAPERGIAGMFFVIGGVIVLSFLVPVAIHRVVFGRKLGGDGNRDSKKKAKWKSTTG